MTSNVGAKLITEKKTLGFADEKENKEKEYENIKTNMLLIQNKIETIAQKVEIKEKDAKYIGIKKRKSLLYLFNR